MSYRYRFDYERDKILALSLNKLEQSNKTFNHHFICKFDRETRTKRKLPKSRLV